MINLLSQSAEMTLCLILATFSLSLVLDGIYGAELFPVNHDVSVLENTDDKSLEVNLTSPVMVAGEEFSWISIVTNGLIAFENNSYGNFSSLGKFHADEDTLLAPCFTDILLRASSPGRIFLQQTTNPSEMSPYTNTIRSLDENFESDWALMASWVDVIHFNQRNVTSSFQVVLATEHSQHKTYAIFNYNQLNWNNSQTREIGFNYGYDDKVDYLPGVVNSSNNGQVLHNTNVGVPGRYVIDIDGVQFCDSDWYLSSSEKSCFKVMTERKRTFWRARRECRKLGAQIATSVYGEDDRNDITDLMDSKTHVWIGVRSDPRSDEYFYENMMAVEGEQPWKKGKPVRPNRRNCVTLRGSAWHDRHCRMKFYFVCEKKRY